MKSKQQQEERESLEMIAGSYMCPEQEEPLWRAFIDVFALNHDWKELLTPDEVFNAYHAFLRALIALDEAAGPLRT
jgi:hypothetical protein